MQFERLAIPEVVLIKPKVHGDSRGFFLETWRADLFDANGVRLARFEGQLPSNVALSAKTPVSR